MTKKMIFAVSLFAILSISCSSNEYDSRAVEALDKLSETIGDLSSCSYTVNSFMVDENANETNKTSDVYLRGSNKMFIKNSGSKGNKSFWYNGEKFAYFLYNKNEYDILDAPDNTLKVIDSINSKYGIYFPAADFLNPNLTDDALENYNQLLFFEDEKIDDIACVMIEATNEIQTVQMWIGKETNLPYKMTIESKTNESDYYEATYSNWRINPKLPDVMFEFQPPAGSAQVKFQPKNYK